VENGNGHRPEDPRANLALDGAASETIAPDRAPDGRSLDPTRIAKLVEREVASMLREAEAEVDRIGSRAMAVVRTVEAKISALQLELDAALDELRELAQHAQPRATAPPTETAPVPIPSSVPEPELDDLPAVDQRPAEVAPVDGGGLRAIITQPPAAMMERLAGAVLPPNLDIPSSDEVGRLLREHLS